MSSLDQSKEVVLDLIQRLSDICSDHPINLVFLELKSREDLYSDISYFLQHHYDRGIFFKLEKSDLKDFLLLNLFTQRLLGLWITMEFKMETKQANSDVIDTISRVQYSEYNSKFNVKGIRKDFQILNKFVSFKQTRVRLTSQVQRTRNLGGLYFEENAQKFGFLKDNEAVQIWYQNYMEEKAEEKEEVKQNGNIQLESKLGTMASFDGTGSFYKFSSE
jgi:hypothetical protein